jgi:hypothetical protein
VASSKPLTAPIFSSGIAARGHPVVGGVDRLDHLPVRCGDAALDHAEGHGQRLGQREQRAQVLTHRLGVRLQPHPASMRSCS